MKNISKFCLLLFSATLFGQDFYGKVEYQTIQNKSKKEAVSISKESEKESAKDALAGIDKEAFEEAMKKAFQKNYLLTFNKNEALFEEIVELEKPKPGQGGVSVSISMSGDGDKYMNTKEKISYTEEDIFGDEFVIKDSLPKIDWQITNETKIIGDYNCVKATYIEPVSKNDLEAYERQQEKIKNGKTTLFQMKKPEPQTITAWYASEIPVSFGPNGVWGLPGLILQLENENYIYFCTKVSLKNNEKVKIKIPNSGKVISKKEYEKYEKKMQKQMEDNDGEFMIREIKN
ncbi:GLPGLI family protein [Flavobacterium sp.]|uniref:GLPGLI family protein n=1 Tax=Flavobacterium sp. TaxID=239 RepID=UPI001B53271E|nr:GLPGLI family protein [Flavobacterium sp.]MBP6126573.1 GLPGLI family protein [Flavobacterium sp.]